MSQSIYHYTYIIKNTTNNIQYIGVRSCNCLPENDSGYMGSSKSLVEAMKVEPETFTKIIIDTFPTREIANTNEQWLHETYDVARNPEFYNQMNAPLGFCMSGREHSKETKEKMSVSTSGKNHPLYGKKRSLETRKNISAAKKGKTKGKNNPNYGKHHSPEARQKMSDANKGENNHNYGKKRSPETCKKLSAANKGKKRSPETCKKISESLKGKNKGKNNPNYGKHHSAETKLKMSGPRGPRGPEKKIQCPHCSKIGGGSTMQRWHFAKCREIS